MSQQQWYWWCTTLIKNDAYIHCIIKTNDNTNSNKATTLPLNCQVYMILAPWHPISLHWSSLAPQWHNTTQMATITPRTLMAQRATMATMATLEIITTTATKKTQCITDNTNGTPSGRATVWPSHQCYPGTLLEMAHPATTHILRWTRQHLASFLTLAEVACKWNVQPG